MVRIEVYLACSVVTLVAASFVTAGCGAPVRDAVDATTGGDAHPADPPGGDTDTPFPVDRGDAADTPGSYRGLPLRLVDNGEPVVESVDGRIGVVCIGPSFANMECGYFQSLLQTQLAGAVASDVVLANCGVGGAGLEAWNDPVRDDDLWRRCIDQVLPARGLRVDQVRVVLHKAVNALGASTTYYPEPGSDYFAVLDNLDGFAARLPAFFPDAAAVYTFSRSYGGYNPDAGRDEPRAYESGHAVNTWLGLNPQRSNVWYGWGPYLWAPDCATGITNVSGVCYERDDYLGDGVHPGPGARQKVADMLHARLSQHAWYRP